MSNKYLNRLKSVAAKKGITQKQISEKTGIPIRTLSRYFNGSRLPTVETALDIAEVLGTTVEELYVNLQISGLQEEIYIIDTGNFQPYIYQQNKGEYEHE